VTSRVTTRQLPTAHHRCAGGRHPFGEHYERDTNILRGTHSLHQLLGRAPEALNLLAAMLSKKPAARPAMAAVRAHPFWWSDEQRLQFLVDVSDRWARGCACVCVCVRVE
jgi:hypothetical protein